MISYIAICISIYGTTPLGYICRETDVTQMLLKVYNRVPKMRTHVITLYFRLVNKEVKKRKAEYYSDLINENKGNAKELWKTLNEITSKKSNSTITSIEADGVLYAETSEIAQALNTHFSNIGTKLAARIKEKLRLIASNSRKFFPPAFSRWNGNNKSFSFCSITESFVLKQLKTLKTNKAIGLDRISARLLKDSAECMAPILTRLFNRSLEASTFPSIWKCAKVSALFKGGDWTDCNN